MDLTKERTVSERARVKQIVQDTARSLADTYLSIANTELVRLNNKVTSRIMDGYVRATNSINHFNDRAARYDSDWYSTVQGYVCDALKGQSELVKKQVDNYSLTYFLVVVLLLLLLALLFSLLVKLLV